MATYSTLPGVLNVHFKRGDELGVTVDFDHALTAGHTVSAVLFSLVTGSVLASLTVAVTNAAAGTASLSLTKIQTGTLPAGTLGFRVTLDMPGSVRRTVLEGFAEAA